MTTAHRPTFDPARGKEALRGPAYNQRLLPAHTQLKYRKPGQGGAADEEADVPQRDLRADLLAAEAAHFAKKNGTAVAGHLEAAPADDDDKSAAQGIKRALEDGEDEEENGDDDDDGGDGPMSAAKRRRILEETRDIDADTDLSDYDSDESDDDSEAELQREMDRIRKERAEKKAKEVRWFPAGVW